MPFKAHGSLTINNKFRILGHYSRAGTIFLKNITFTEDTISVDLNDGRTITVPLAWFPRLLHATYEQLSINIGHSDFVLFIVPLQIIGKGNGALFNQP